MLFYAFLKLMPWAGRCYWCLALSCLPFRPKGVGFIQLERMDCFFQPERRLENHANWWQRQGTVNTVMLHWTKGRGQETTFESMKPENASIMYIIEMSSASKVRNDHAKDAL